MIKASFWSSCATLLITGVLVADDPAQWQESRSKEGGYSVRFPGKPEDDTKPFVLGGEKYKLFLRAAKESSGAIFSVAYVDFPADYVKKKGPKNIARGIQRGFLQKATSKPAEKEIKVGDYWALECSASFKVGDVEGITHSRALVVGNRGYVLMIMGLKSRPPDQKSTDRFWASFKLLSEPK